MIRFGTNPIAWANDDDRSIGADIPTETILHEAGALIGFDGIENGHRWPDDPESLRALLARYGLAFVSGWYSCNLLVRSVADEIAACQPHLAKLKHNGCAVMIVCETSNAVHGDPACPVNDRPRLDAAGMRDFGAKLEAFAAYLAGQGVTLVYHHHMGTIVESPPEIDALMAATGPHTQLLFDAGHCAFGGGDPVAVMARHIGRVRHFHAKNIRPDVVARARAEGLSFLQGVLAGAFTVPGDPEGGIDFEPLLRLLADHGYDGWIVIEAEQDPKVRNPLLYQTLGLHTLKRLAAKVGQPAPYLAPDPAEPPPPHDRPGSRDQIPWNKEFANPLLQGIWGAPGGNLLRKPVGRSGLIHDLTPVDAGWQHVGFQLHRLAPGESATGNTGADESILVLVEGHADISAAGQDWGRMGDRLDVFEQTPPHALYVPPGQDWQASAVTPCTLAVCLAPGGKGDHPVWRLGPDGIETVPRGEGTNRRYIHNIAMEDRDVAASLLVTEVFTPPGHWSSYPSHRHDEDDFPRITLLEETYYHRLNPARGFGIQRVYTEDGALDETMTVKNHDLVLVPRGHHPCAAPHGYAMYYLNVMAGPLRKWRFQPDPDHAWLM